MTEEFGWSDSTTKRFMRVANNFKLENFSNLKTRHHRRHTGVQFFFMGYRVSGRGFQIGHIDRFELF